MEDKVIKLKAEIYDALCAVNHFQKVMQDKERELIAIIKKVNETPKNSVLQE
jgi:hypothetical protein